MRSKVLELKNIHKSYKKFGFFNLFKKERTNKIRVLRNISLKINKSEIIGISGNNGSGKSTLLRVISGIESYDSGLIHSTQNLEIRYIPANDRSFFWRLNVIENLELFNLYSSLNESEIKKKMNYYIEIFKLNDSKKIEFMKLSSGQKRKLILIRALLSGSEILLFDEVAANLDEESKSVLFNELLELKKNKDTSIVWVSHDRNELYDFCDRTFNMADINECS